MPTPDEDRLREKLARIEALFAGTTNHGERAAAGEAKERIRARLLELLKDDPPVEHRFKVDDPWARMLLLALMRRYEIQPYRKYGQRRTTVMARVPKRFVDETLWPEFSQLERTLHAHLHEVTERVIAQALHADSSDASEVAGLPDTEPSNERAQQVPR